MSIMPEILTEQMRQEIDQWRQKFPKDQPRSASLMALRIVQNEVGYLTPEWMTAVAEYLNIPVTQVYEVATFYGMYHHKPVGRFHVRICNNISCCLKGSHQATAYLRDKLGVVDQPVSDDGLFSLSETECLAACTDAPVMVVNDREYIRQLTPKSIDDWIAQCRAQENHD
ncbi:MAG: NADH-quinone oxidoreductase subunit NuoE [Candidatus Comchoanobacterales bacterium]